MRWRFWRRMKPQPPHPEGTRREREVLAAIREAREAIAAARRRPVGNAFEEAVRGDLYRHSRGPR